MESRFIKIFSGLERNYGYCNVKNGYTDPDTGKLKFKPGDYGWSQDAVTDQDYFDHLNGEKSIGIQPCNDEGMACFGAIDIDPERYKDFNAKYFFDIIVKWSLPVVPVKSKSGGLHIFVFLNKKIKASLIRNFLDKLLFTFKLKQTTEIFPKQTELGTTDDGTKINGNFINLPYYNKTERVAVNPHDGTEFTLEQFIQVVETNLQTQESIENFGSEIINKQLKFGDEEFNDGPPCLQALTENKLTDGRDRFLYNYMVFSKKKYPDDWEKKVEAAARKYFEYSPEWDDNRVKLKIRSWKKETKGHTCTEDPIVNHCVKSVCVRRKFGIASDKKKTWPMLSNLVKYDYKPEPEFWLTVTLPDKGSGETKKQIVARSIDKLIEMRELRKIIAAQTSVIPPKIKDNDFQIILDTLKDTEEVMQPASGTSPEEQLHKYLNDYIFQVIAKTYASFKNGSTLIEEDHAYFVYEHFFNHLKNKDWRIKEDRTATLMQKNYHAVFGERKRFPKSKAQGIYCVKISLQYFTKEETMDEVVEMKNQDEIL